MTPATVVDEKIDQLMEYFKDFRWLEGEPSEPLQKLLQAIADVQNNNKRVAMSEDSLLKLTEFLEERVEGTTKEEWAPVIIDIFTDSLQKGQKSSRKIGK